MKIKKALSIILLIISIFSISACSIAFSSEDAQALNKITENNIITASVKVVSLGNRDFLSGKYEASQGSGVIFKKESGEDESTYYLLTNNHVIYGNKNGYLIYDCFGNEIKAYLVNQAYDANYDLAVLKFNSPNEYTVLPISLEDEKIGSKIIAIGNPNGKFNSITMGKVQGYTKITLSGTSEDESNVSFDCLEHSAPINSGSSGGFLINYNFEICGINFACDRLEDGVFVASFAVQSTKILEFLQNHNL